MTAKLGNISPPVKAVLIGVLGSLVLFAGVYFVVMPQRHKAATLTEDIAKTKTQIVAAHALATQKPEERIRVADLFKVVQAMPDDSDMSGVILQLQQTAREAGVSFDSIQPQPLSPGAGYDLQPIDLAFVGNYYSLTDFLFRLRKLVSVHRGTLDATGRLFSVGRIDFAPGENGFPQIAANVHVNAYVYNSASVGAMLAPPPPEGDNSPADTSTAAVASGVTP